MGRSHKGQMLCPAALTLKEFLKKIGQNGEVAGKSKRAISYAFFRAGLREEIPEIEEPVGERLLCSTVGRLNTVILPMAVDKNVA